MAAGPEYKTSGLHQFFWGNNYRKEWATPIKVPTFMLDTAKGGLKPTKAGGGNQTKSLQLETKTGKEYALRTVNKTLGKVLPKAFLNTFIENLVNDKVSMSHPYAAGTVPLLAKSAKVYHTYPQYFYLPQQPGLDTFNKAFANKMYLFEQKVDGDWKEAANLGKFSDYKGTDKVLENRLEDNDTEIDQKQFIRSRIFDWFINDWDRHEDQWEWGVIEGKDDRKLYIPVPQDRDQAYFKFNGALLKPLIAVSGIKYFQPFKKDLEDIKTFNYEERNLDRFFANEMSLSDWQSIARNMQQSITDGVIEAAIKQFPPEIYAISGRQVINTLKARRGKLEKWATAYYNFIAKEVDVTGSEKREHFEVKRLADNKTEVNIYKISKDGKQDSKPFYSRTFNAKETNEIRLYGLSGNDTYTVSGDERNTTQLRLIGGNERDSMTIAGRGKVHIYDNNDNSLQLTTPARLHLSGDSAIHAFEYKSFRYSKSGISPTIFYTNEDRLFVGLAYNLLRQGWRKKPFAAEQKINLNYSLSQQAPSVIYNGLFPKALGKFDLNLYGNWDAVRWTNFFGLGNETQFTVRDIDYYRTRSEEWQATAGVIRRFGTSTFRINGLYQSFRVINDPIKYVARNLAPINADIYSKDQFAGGQLIYSFHAVNDSIVPTSGVAFVGTGTFRQNIKDKTRSVGNYQGHLQLYVPLISKFSLAIRVGGETVTGTPEFYQFAQIGGGQTLRAFRMGRFWGKSAFYNSNEFRFISNMNTYLLNGKAGLVAFFDNGRVWMPNEKSDVWHTGFGGGILLAPFNKILADVTYGVSKDESLIQLRLSKSF